MSKLNLDEPGFTAPAGSTAPPSSDSSAEPTPDSRSKCLNCPRRMSAKTADRRVVCRGYDCNLETRCEKCIEWPDEEVRLYAKMRKSLKSNGSSKHRPKPSASSPPPAASMPPSQPHALVDMQTQVDALHSMMSTLSDSLFNRMDALQAFLASSVPQPSSRPSHRPDAGSPQPGVTAGESRTFQALGETTRKFAENVRLDQGVRPPRQEFATASAASQHRAAPGAAPQPSAFVPPRPSTFVPPPRHEVPPQPSTSGWVPSGPQPPHSRGSRSSSESEFTALESSSSRLTDLIYDVCPHSRPLLDVARPPRCEFEGWFGQPEVPASRPRFRLYPRVGEVESDVTAKASSLARRSKPLSSILTTHYTRHAVADLPYYASSLAVNPSFSQLAGAKAVGSKRWGSVSFAEMEKLERLFRAQLEMASQVSLADVRNFSYAEA